VEKKMSDETEEAVDQDAMADEWAAAMEEQGDAESDANTEPDAIEQMAVGPISPSTELGGDVKIDVILDIPVTISMEIGRTQLSIRNLLQLNQGSVVELDRFAGEPMDVLVNGTLVAHGEVVVVNEKFGIRLTDVISPADRIKNLR
jgi:flagellar motor switch protein FliN/FliY